MSTPTSLAITVTIDSGLETRTGHAIAETSLAYATALIRDLALPAAATVVIKTGSAAQLSIGSMTIAVAKRPQRRLEDDVDVALYQARRYFVTTDVVTAYAQSIWNGHSLGPYLHEHLRELMCLCIERNTSLRRLSAVLVKMQPADLWNTSELLHQTHCERNLSVSVECGFNVKSVLFPLVSEVASFRRRVQKQVFATIGVLTPLASVSEGVELGAAEWGVHINDVALPADPLKACTAADLERSTTDVIVDNAATLITRDGVERLLKIVAQNEPRLVGEVLKRIGLNRLTLILCKLAASKTSLRNLPTILDALIGSFIIHEIPEGTELLAPPLDVVVPRKVGDGVRPISDDEYVTALAQQFR